MADPDPTKIASESWSKYTRLIRLIGERQPKSLSSMEDLRKLVVNLSAVALFLIGASIVVKASLTTANIIEPIGIPQELSQLGYTSDIVAKRILDEINEVNRAVKTSRGRAAFSALLPEHPLPKLDIPGGGLSLDGFVSSLRQLIGKSDTKIAGEITTSPPPTLTSIQPIGKPDAKIAGETTVSPPSLTIEKGDKKMPAKLFLRLRISGKGSVHAEAESSTHVDALFAAAALQIVEQMQPYMAAVYYKNKQKNYAKAERAIELCLRNPEDVKWGLNLRGVIAFEEGRLDDAIAEYTWVTERYGFALSHYNLAQALNAKGEKEKDEFLAEEYFRQALDTALLGLVRDENPASRALGYVNAGLALENLKELDEALKNFQRAARSDPRHFNAYRNQGNILLKQKRFDKAIEMFRMALEIEPTSVSSYRSWAQAARARARDGDKSLAASLVEKAIAIDPRNQHSYHLRGNLYFDDQDWETASEYFQKAIDIDPGLAAAHFNRGLALRNLDRLTEATAAFQAAVENAPANNRYRAMLAEMVGQSRNRKDMSPTPPETSPGGDKEEDGVSLSR